MRPPRYRRSIGLVGSLAVLFAASCRHATPPSPAPAPAGSALRDRAAPADDNAAGRLRALAEAYWAAHLQSDPVEATLLGVHGYDDRLPDASPAGRLAERRRLAELQERLRAELPDGTLNGAERVTRDLLAGQLESDLAVADCGMKDWAVDPRDGPQVTYLDLAGLQPVKTPADGGALLARWRAMPAALDQATANVLRALAAGKTSARSEVERVARQLDELLAKPDAAWPLAAPADRVSAGAWPAPEVARFRGDILRAITEGIRPAFERYRTAIRHQILPRARGDAAVGIGHVAGGDRCYRALVRVHTSLPLDPIAVHQLGLDELRRIRAEMQALGPTAIGSGDFGAIQKRLRGEPRDPAMFFHTRDEIEATAREALARASTAMPRFLQQTPRTGCTVKRIESHEEKDAPIAYYRQPAIDGSRPGAYYVNTYDPESRPRFESEALAFHEAVPGHHIQIAVAQELTGVPDFRKHLGVTAFVEGWGLYAEQLALELGLYSSPLTRMGQLNLEAWRAARLVVDTGIHALGWSRSQAIAFMTENTAVAANNIQNEVDRYIGWPGQALAYKIGQLELLKLRAEARRRLGTAFNLGAFHGVVLGSGAVSLPVLRNLVVAWTDSQSARSSTAAAADSGRN